MEYLFTRRKQRVDELKCNNCKYKTNVSNTEETGTAICSYPQGEWFVVNVEDSCHYIPEKKELTCGDCSRLNEDTGCFACQETDSAMYNGHLCIGFIDKREEEFNSILMFWKVQGLYDREKINKLLDDFEQSYDRLFNQG